MTLMTKCDEGHFYDKEQNSSGCPFCGVGAPDLTKKFDADRADEPTARYAPKKHDDATRAYGSAPAPSAPAGDADRTMAIWSRGGGIDPVVGFLICTEGANQGRDYRIRSGYNNIGRDTSQQICIVGDDTISRVEHAKLFYDPKNASFHVIAGSGRCGIYVNGQVVLQPLALQAYDVLEIGATKLTFLPFCGDRFRWDTGTAAAAPATAPPVRQAQGPAPKPPQDPDMTQGVR